jgi:hypothetical protein
VVVRLLGAVPRLVRLDPPEWELPRPEVPDEAGKRLERQFAAGSRTLTGQVRSA